MKRYENAHDLICYTACIMCGLLGVIYKIGLCWILLIKKLLNSNEFKKPICQRPIWCPIFFLPFLRLRYETIILIILISHNFDGSCFLGCYAFFCVIFFNLIKTVCFNVAPLYVKPNIIFFSCTSHENGKFLIMDWVAYSPVDKFLHHKWNCLGNWRTIYTT